MVTSDAKFALNLDSILTEIPLRDIVLAKPTTSIQLEPENTEENIPYVVNRVSVIAQEIEKTDQNESKESEE